MASSDSLSGKILTVTGPINPENLGKTLTHEHAEIKYEYFYFDVGKKPVQEIADEPITLENIGWIREHQYSNKANLRVYGDECNTAVIDDLTDFKRNGGGSIVECTTIGIGRNMQHLKQFSQASGVNIISGTGFYLAGDQSPNREDNHILSKLPDQSEESIATLLTKDIMEGADGTDVRCGVIGEVASCYPITDVEKKVLRAVASVQNQLGCPVSLHPEDFAEAPFEIMRVLQEAGADCQKTVMSHLDYTLYKVEDYLEFADFGTYLELDFFGTETSNWDFNAPYMMNDGQRINIIKQLLDEGLEDRIVIAHDIHTRNHLTKYGGHGYSHILLNVVPKMLQRGISQESIDKILIHNPKRWLTFK
ncbi:N-acetyltaurine hydrolase-like [Glandiceps talaboti]